MDPLNGLINTELGFFLYWARRYDDAIEQIQKTLELDPIMHGAHTVLGWSLIWKGNNDRARAEFQKAMTLNNLPWYLSSLGYAYAAAGDQAKAEQVLRQLEDLSKQRYVSPANLAAIHLGFGDKTKALDWLEKAYEDLDPMLWWNQDQLCDSVRNEPRFQAIMEKVDRLKAAGSPRLGRENPSDRQARNAYQKRDSNYLFVIKVDPMLDDLRGDPRYEAWCKR